MLRGIHPPFRCRSLNCVSVCCLFAFHHRAGCAAGSDSEGIRKSARRTRILMCSLSILLSLYVRVLFAYYSPFASHSLLHSILAGHILGSNAVVRPIQVSWISHSLLHSILAGRILGSNAVVRPIRVSWISQSLQRTGRCLGGAAPGTRFCSHGALTGSLE